MTARGAPALDGTSELTSESAVSYLDANEGGGLPVSPLETLRQPGWTGAE